MPKLSEGYTLTGTTPRDALKPLKYQHSHRQKKKRELHKLSFEIVETEGSSVFN